MQTNINGAGTGGILTNAKEELLLLKRKKPPESGCWSIPGGAIEFGETAEEAILREFQEEIGLPCVIKEFLGYYDYILLEEHRHWLSLFFVLKSQTDNSPQNMEPEKHAELQWFALEELPSNLTQNTVQAITLYKKWMNENHRI